MSAESPRRSNLCVLLLTQARKKLFFPSMKGILLLTLRTWQIFANLIMERLTILRLHAYWLKYSQETKIVLEN
jgi:hypothetical protein